MLRSGEYHHLEVRQLCQQTNFFTFPPPGQHCMTHFLGKVKTNAAQYPVTTVKACFFSWSRGDTSDHVVCDRQSETNRGWAWAELWMWHGVICSDGVGVGNVGGGNSRGGDRSHSCLFIRCFFPSTLVWLLDWSGDTRYERQREEYQACGKCGGRKAKLTTEKEHLRCWRNCRICFFCSMSRYILLEYFSVWTVAPKPWFLKRIVSFYLLLETNNSDVMVKCINIKKKVYIYFFAFMLIYIRLNPILSDPDSTDNHCWCWRFH